MTQITSGGFEITCSVCGKDGGEIASAEMTGRRYIAIRCPHCQRVVAKPADGTEWKEVVLDDPRKN